MTTFSCHFVTSTTQIPYKKSVFTRRHVPKQHKKLDMNIRYQKVKTTCTVNLVVTPQNSTYQTFASTYQGK